MNINVKKEIVNFLLEKAREHQFSLEELEEALELIKRVFYTDATIR